MHILLDECVPRQLKRLLTGHLVRTVQEMGWVGTANGDLLRAAQGEFDVLLTVDASIPRQHPLARYTIGLLVVMAASNALEDIEPHVPDLLAALPTVRPGEVTVVGHTDNP